MLVPIKIDLLVKNGNILTMNKDQPTAEALAVKDGKILSIGSNEQITNRYPHVEKVIDLAGKMVCPGFYDTHTHLLSYGVRSFDVSLTDVQSPQEAIQKIEQRAKKVSPGEWIFGFGWDETNWDEKRPITRQELDQIAPKNPTYIRRVCGHLAVLNSKALQELNIKWDDPDLELDSETDEPTGIIKDAIIDRIADSKKLQRSQEEINEAVKPACYYANAVGVTSVADNLSISQVKAYITAWRKNELTVRVCMNIPKDHFAHYFNAGLKTGFGDDFLKIGGIKIFTDGSIGAWTAALNEPYYDDDSSLGEFYIEEEKFQALIKKAVKNDWQTATHAIGDRAIEFVLRAFEQIEDPERIKKERHRIEHAEFLLDDQLQRAKELGLILSMQPNFAGRWGRPQQLYELRLGSERYKLLNNFRKIIDANALMTFGSDNMPMDPLYGIWSVVTHPIDDIKISVPEALYHYTLGAAYSSFDEDIKGSLEPNKLADFVVLEHDILSIDPDEIKNTKVLMTFVNGKKVYDANNQQKPT
ncbi:MAG: amidohydrolase family protein [Candidatus Heimdallarchaeota archaeon]|nr:amidohydrolase family protein [Candidatus Heimdallarchaeota archaeon]